MTEESVAQKAYDKIFEQHEIDLIISKIFKVNCTQKFFV